MFLPLPEFGVAVAAFTGWAILDPLIAALVALNILWMGYGLMKESVAGLMDAAVSPEVQDRIQTLIAEQGSGALQAHDVRTRHAGRVTRINASVSATWLLATTLRGRGRPGGQLASI